MSLVDDARVHIFMAEFVTHQHPDLGTYHAIGANLSMLWLRPGSTSTIAFSVMATVRIPEGHEGEECVLSLELYNVTADAPVLMPDGRGGVHALRAQDLSQVARLPVPEGYLGPGPISPITLSMSFAAGLGLEPGVTYEWRCQINGRSRGWTAPFPVLSEAGDVPRGRMPPVVGGPAGPGTIEGVQWDGD
jgi:hypothetical protein